MTARRLPSPSRSQRRRSTALRPAPAHLRVPDPRARQLQAMRADNCKRAKASKAMFDSGVRVARTNEKGEREIMDDAQRAAEVQRIQKIIASDCKT